MVLRPQRGSASVDTISLPSADLVVKETLSTAPRDDLSQVVHQENGLDLHEAAVCRPAVEGSVNHPAQAPVRLVAEESNPPTTVICSTHQATTQRFSLSLFQRTTIFDTLIQRLQVRRISVPGWRVAGQPPPARGTAPARRRLRDLNASQIYECLKSGGKSVNALPRPVDEKVCTPSPLV